MIKRFLAAMLVAVAAVVPAAALAFGAQSGQNITLPRGETKTGTYYVAARTVTVDGDVDGDLICAGNNVTVNGAVHGDVICAAQTLTVNGPVDGSVRLAGQVVTLTSTVGRNGTIAAQTVTIGSAAHVVGDLGLAAQTASVNGAVDKDVYGGVDSLSLGAATGAVTVWLNTLDVGPSANVKGDLKYTSDQTFDVNKSKVSGSIQRTAPAVSKVERENDAARTSLALRLYWIFASLLVGVVLALLAPKFVGRITETMRKRPGASIGWGLIVTLLGPVLFLLLLVTVIGIPLAFLEGALWLLMLAMSGLFAGIAAGEWFLERAEWRRSTLLGAAALGIPLTVIIFSIPVLGFLAGIVATWWAVGGMSLSAKPLRS
jgi:cytoskeletal protein CcmA (bactofilin family)